ncbi:MAG: hypothetical protein ACXVQY_01085 [Actinomycetota bacterium]
MAGHEKRVDRHFSESDLAARARAVRAVIRGRAIDLLERRGLLGRRELDHCPSCGDRVIHLEQPTTFVYDRARADRVCSACGAERDLLVLMEEPLVDIGGEGGA